MADIFTPGPLHLFGDLSEDGSSPFYLGTCVTAPDTEAEKFKIPVMNDLGGRSVPFQLIKDGEIWMVSCTLNRFNRSGINSLLALDSSTNGTLGASLGSETGTARGTLVLGVSDWSLIVINQYANTPAAGTTPAALAGGRRYHSANIRKYKENTEGTRVLEVAMSIELQNLFNNETLGFTNYSVVPANQAAEYLALIT